MRRTEQQVGGADDIDIRRRKGKRCEELQSPAQAENGQWFLHNDAPRQFRTNISDLICKHLIDSCQRQQRLGTSHFCFLRENVVEGTDALLYWTGCIRIAAEVEFKFQGLKDTHSESTWYT